MKTLNLFLVMAWGIVLCFPIFTDNLEALLSHQTVNFTWNSTPDFHRFLYFSDITLIHPFFYVVKLGHFIGFAILDLLLFNWLSSHSKSVLLAFGIAVLTEVLQLFFGRDGRLYDVMIDSLGILSVYVLLKSSIKKESTYYIR